jgi:hypothetical protein
VENRQQDRYYICVAIARGFGLQMFLRRSIPKI